MTVLVIGRGPTIVASVVSAIQSHGFDSVGVTTDAEALSLLETRAMMALVIGGGVQWGSRRALRRKAEATGAAVIQGALGNRDIPSYVREELVPRLRPHQSGAQG